MDSMQINKAIAAILIAGIAFFITGLLGDQLVRVHHLDHTVLKIEEAAAPTTAPGAKDELTPIGPLLATADPAAGEGLAKKPASPATPSTKAAKQASGRTYGVVGAKHAHMEGFNYTDGMKAKAGPWTFDELERLAEEAGRLRAGHPHGLCRDQQRQAARRRNRLPAHPFRIAWSRYRNSLRAHGSSARRRPTGWSPRPRPRPMPPAQ